jgi:tellurite methyltransferase
MSDSQLREKWDSQYRTGNKLANPPKVLVENLHLLPRSGLALDLACGMGAGALMMAQQGLTVDAWDISSVAIDQLSKTAIEQQLPIKAVTKNVELSPLEPAHYDVILVSHFLVREMAESLMAALKPGGLLLYQTYTRVAVSKGGPSNPAYRLADNELLTLFAPLKLRYYREEGVLGDVSQGVRNIAMLVAERC